MNDEPITKMHADRMKLFDAVSAGVHRCRKALLGPQYHTVRRDEITTAAMGIIDQKLSVGETMVLAQFLAESVEQNIAEDRQLASSAQPTS